MAKYLPDFRDVLILAGLVLLGIGLWMLSPPIMFIVIGGLLLVIGLVAAWLKGGRMETGDGLTQSDGKPETGETR